MNHRIAPFARAVGVACALVAGAASAQSVVNGPYYSTPSWDQTMPASTRFVVLANFNSQAVLDRETGLVWQRAVNDPQYDSVAGQLCHQATTGGRYGWRLPSIAEASSLFDPAVTTIPSLPTGHPFTGFGTSQVTLWTSSRDPSFAPRAPGRALLRNTHDFGATQVVVLNTEDGSSATAPFLCVRGGGGRDDY